jgi:tRNA threonylcarbamoyladenosine biosynthesis protein TsaB
MIILAMDTALSACSAAVLDTGGGEDRVVERSEWMARGHAEALMPLIGDLLAALEVVILISYQSGFNDSNCFTR